MDSVTHDLYYENTDLLLAVDVTVRRRERERERKRERERERDKAILTVDWWILFVSSGQCHSIHIMSSISRASYQYH